ncbi:hypothetical protein Ddye_010552 [Dipteronia dyeriana]|uniref:RING-type E3 ubiquitin transferase n=1 Tax=Dipteronia dyeriana TaxID=168575 RepID=A0AAD9XDS7_9ROSI|nr:hypothetical protein Ddye_010552 [Dipteronia dyeriana]
MEGERNSSKRTREDDNTTSGQQLWIGESSNLASSQPSRDPERQAAAVTAEDNVSSSGGGGSTNHPTNYSNDRLIIVSDQLASNEEYTARYRFRADHPAMYHFNIGAGVLPAILRRNIRRRTGHENNLRQRQQQQQDEEDNVNMMQPRPPQHQWRNSDFASPSNQMPPSRHANNTPMAAPHTQAADYSAEHQRMRDRFIAQNNNMARNDQRQAAANDEPRPPLTVRSITAAEWRDIVARRSQAAQLPQAPTELGDGTIGSVLYRVVRWVIYTNLRQREFHPIEAGSPAPGECCCICQEKYASGEVIGNLDCGHVYHVECITQWVLLKNSCPICKAPALAALERLH